MKEFFMNSYINVLVQRNSPKNKVFIDEIQKKENLQHQLKLFFLSVFSFLRLFFNFL